jgi:hypothetical protein
MSFFKLPLELRLSIYEHLLAVAHSFTITIPTNRVTSYSVDSPPPFFVIENDTIWLNNIGRPDQGPHAHPDLYPSILATCAKIYAEARHILYSKNVFIFDDWHDVVAFLKKVGTESAKDIAYAEVRPYTTHAPVSAEPSCPNIGCSIFQVLAVNAPHLRRLRIHGYPHERNSSVWDDIVRALGKIRNLERLELIGFSEEQKSDIDAVIDCKVESYPALTIPWEQLRAEGHHQLVLAG